MSDDAQERSVRDLDVTHSRSGKMQFWGDETEIEVYLTPQEEADPDTRRAIAKRLDVLWKYTPDVPTREVVHQLTLGRTLKGDIERQEQEKRDLRQERDALREACRIMLRGLKQMGEYEYGTSSTTFKACVLRTLKEVSDPLDDVQPEAAEAESHE